MVPTEIETNAARVTDAFIHGELVVFLGAGANLCDRPDGWRWVRHQSEHLPSGIELSQHLVTAFHMDDPQSSPDVAWRNADLARVAQAVVLEMGDGPLKRELHTLLDTDYPLTALHRLLAGLPRRLRNASLPRTSDPILRRLLIVSTNYDDLQERAFAEARQPFHLVRYQAIGLESARFYHRPPMGGPERPITGNPQLFRDILADEQPVLMKFHGGVDRNDRTADSFVITEDDYIEYLSSTANAKLIPAPVPGMLKSSHVLFLGHALRDWNLRVILYQLLKERNDSYKWWAIQHDPYPFEKKFWASKEVVILDCGLNVYIELLDESLRAGGV